MPDFFKFDVLADESRALTCPCLLDALEFLSVKAAALVVELFLSSGLAGATFEFPIAETVFLRFWDYKSATLVDELPLVVDAPYLPIILSLLLFDVTEVFNEFYILFATGVLDLCLASAKLLVWTVGVLELPLGVFTVEPLPAAVVLVFAAAVVILPAPALDAVVVVGTLHFFSSS